MRFKWLRLGVVMGTLVAAGLVVTGEAQTDLLARARALRPIPVATSPKPTSPGRCRR
jgi:hypothetical protein